ncbi:MAG: glutamine--fructose-6-phosphate transaminase (isomerizing) [Candidatus Aureabacteria bacterium]|nr:glutamine--fructose-6-phosphate transaminase (isomerizing) [Candidatus Auribacterota bacterium]
MCGIIGYVGKEKPLPFIVKGLESLEYRGYDSAGTSCIDAQGNFFIKKVKGRVKSLEDSISQISVSTGLGIAHTRWATHGAPNVTNAHPHVDSRNTIAVVHNGIIENHFALKQELKQKGYKLVSETDTEVIPHLIAEELKNSLTYQDAFIKAVNKLEGSFAIVVIFRNDPEKRIYAARMDSPLIVGIMEGAYYIASDIAAMIHHTKNVIYLNDGEIFISDGSKMNIFDFQGNEIEARLETITWNIEKAEKKGFDTFMLKEINEQPEILRKIVQHRIRGKQIFFEELKLSRSYLKKVRRIYLTACGTAYHACFLGKYYIEEFTDLPAEVILSSEFRYTRPKLGKGELVISISQSGETADTLASLREAKRNGSKVLSLCNVAGSTIERESDGVVYTHAGLEIGVASTKAYTSQVLTIFLLSLYLSHLRSEDKSLNKELIFQELKEIAQKAGSVLDDAPKIRKCAKKYYRYPGAFYLGRHFNYPTALEGALKNKEISYMHAEGYAAGEMKHGPIALIDQNFPVFCIATQGQVYDKMISNIEEVHARKGLIVSLATAGDDKVKIISSDVIYVPHTIEELSPIINIIAFQLVAYHIARFKGCDIDKPRNLAKSVTVE